MRIRSGHHGEQGWRPTMEDEEIAIEDVTTKFKLDKAKFPPETTQPHSFFAVLDGHCGNKVMKMKMRERGRDRAFC